MKVLAKDVFTPHRDGRAVFPGFIRYIDAHKPTLMHRYGWVDGSDTYDHFTDSISTDNGQSWSEPVMALQKTTESQGAYRYVENAAFFDATTGLLHTITSHGLYNNENLDIGQIRWQLHFDIYNTNTGQWGESWRSDMGFAEGIMLSFSVPIETKEGVILWPVQKKMVDDKGNFIAMPGYWTPRLESLVLQGRRQSDGSIQWTPGTRVGVSDQLSSRGLCEPAIAQLNDGRIAMVCRGDNGFYPEKPGYKWVCYSSDLGNSWTQPVPLTLADGSPIESAACGSTLFRSHTTDQLYWMGNLAIDQRPKGNWPRHPLVIARVQEEPFGLIQDSITTIDTKQPGEDNRVQMSNFRYYQDRQNGELVVFLTRYGENLPDHNFKVANYYRYRVALDE